MRSARLVVAEISLVHRDRPFVPQQGTQCHHVSLLDRFRATDALRSEVHINRRRATPLCSDIDFFEL